MELMEIFDFTASDLEANRRGALSDRQRQQLRGILVGTRRGASPWLTVAIVTVFFLVAGWMIFGRGESSSQNLLIFGAIALVDLIVLPVVLMSNLRRQRLTADRMEQGLQAGVVVPLHGEVHAGEAPSAYSPTDTRQMGGYAISMAGQRLLFRTRHLEALAGVFAPGQTYTAYCFDTGSGKYLLSMESG